MDARYREPYLALLNLYFRLVQTQAGKKIDEANAWAYDSETLAIKLFRHLISLARLAEDHTVEFDPAGRQVVTYVDHASVHVLARAAFETYLVFHFIYACEERTLTIFRHNTWQLGGFMDRQALHAFTDHAKQKQRDELATIQRLQDEVSASSHFAAYSPKQKRRLLEGDWRVNYSWKDLGRLAGFHDKYFESVYGYLCGAAHASYASAFQIGQARNIADQRGLAESVVGIGLVILAHFAFTYVKAFPDAAPVLNDDPHAKATAETWCFNAKDMEPFWGAN